MGNSLGAAVAPTAAQIPPVGAMIDAMPTGRFHALHLMRQILLNACFAYLLEINPYIYPGMSTEFGINALKETFFASAFAFGGIVGAATSSLQDSFGRRRVIIYSTGFSLFFAALLIPMQLFYVLCAVRFFLGVAFFTMQYSFSAWFTEFLPTFNRGPLYAALTAGYPVGRALVIGASSFIPNELWRVHLILSVAALTIVFGIATLVGESPRYLAVKGQHAEARRRVHGMYRFNGTPLPYDASVAARLTWGQATTGETPAKETSPLVGKPKSGGSSNGQTPGLEQRADSISSRGVEDESSLDFFARLGRLCSSPPPSLGFAIFLFMGLSIQQQLIGNFGPRVFQRLIYPSVQADLELDARAAFPIPALLLFNFSDWGGILLSVLLIDRLGRRGFFTVGFSSAAILWIALGLLGHFFDETGYGGVDDPNRGVKQTVLLTVTALASATRGFAPEAANLWVLETFATDQRATCYAAVNMCYQITASIVVPIGGYMVDHTGYEPTPLLLGYGVIQLILGAFTCFLPNETANKALRDVSGEGSAAEESVPLKPANDGVLKDAESETVLR